MEIELTTRWIEHKTLTEKREIKEGDAIEYYYEGNKMIDNPSEGEVKRDDDGLYIDWDDSEPTRLDGSDRTNDILKNCGWG